MNTDYETKEFNHVVYHYINCFDVKMYAQVEAFAIRKEGRCARVVKMGQRWGVYATEAW